MSEGKLLGGYVEARTGVGIDVIHDAAIGLVVATNMPMPPGIFTDKAREATMVLRADEPGEVLGVCMTDRQTLGVIRTLCQAVNELYRRQREAGKLGDPGKPWEAMDGLERMERQMLDQQCLDYEQAVWAIGEIKNLRGSLARYEGKAADGPKEPA